MSIIISQGGKNAKKLERTVIQQEDYLQKYIYDNPESLPLHELKEDLRLLILAREFPTDSGPIDALGVDADGEIYVIETKLYKNPDKRRVIAQMLDYGASLWSSYGGGPGQLITKLEEVVTSGFSMGLGPKLRDFYGIEDVALTDYLEALKQNVRDGRFRFVVLMDRLDDRLKDLISFVNTNSRFDVLGVELDFYQHQDLEIIIPNLYGAERKKDIDKPDTRRKWDEPSFFEQAEQLLGKQGMQPLRELYGWSRERADEITWGTGKTGSFNVKFSYISARSVFSVWSNGLMRLNFKWVNDSTHSEEYAQRLGKYLQEAKLFNLPANFMSEYPRVPLNTWGPNVHKFIEILERTLESREASDSAP